MKTCAIILPLAAVLIIAAAPATCAQNAEKGSPAKHMSGLPKQHRYTNPTGDEFPIMAWFSLLGDQVAPDRYREMAEAGFNLSFSHFSSAEQVAEALDACRGSGVKILITCAEMASDPEETVRRFRRERDNAGYFLRDEPICDAFPELAEWARRIRSADDSRMLYLNLLPNYVHPRDLHADSYADYVRRFIEEVGLGLVSFDNYPVTFDGVRPQFYANLEDISSESRRAGVPFWAFALATAHDPYPAATRASLRLQIFSNLAYGAQGIQYFTYTSPGTETWNFHNAPIDHSDRRTEVYDLVRELNREVQALGDVFLGARTLWVRHTGSTIPEGTSPLGELPPQIRRVESDGEGVAVSLLQNGRMRYLMVVNRSLDRTQRVTVEAAEGVMRIMSDGRRIPAARYSPTLAVEAGDMLLFGWEE